MKYRPEIKKLAYELNPTCWASYSGRTKQFKQEMDKQRTQSLDQATTQFFNENPISMQDESTGS